jgi:hypothetical protein
MFHPDTNARRMLVQERHDTLARDALRPEQAREPVNQTPSGAFHVLRAQLALLSRASSAIR